MIGKKKKSRKTPAALTATFTNELVQAKLRCGKSYKKYFIEYSYNKFKLSALNKTIKI